MSFLNDSNRIAAELRAKSKTTGRGATIKTAFELVRLPEVARVTGLGRSTIYNLMNPENPQHDPSFPKPLKLAARRVAWRADEIVAWLESRPRASFGEIAGDDEHEAVGCQAADPGGAA